jgi:hypothetical protein
VTILIACNLFWYGLIIDNATMKKVLETRGV